MLHIVFLCTVHLDITRLPPARYLALKLVGFQVKLAE